MTPIARPIRSTTTVVGALLLLALAPSVTHATSGYFSHGYGTSGKGLAGAGVALPQDALAAATNPAGHAWLGTRYDAGIAFFSPSRRYTVAGAPSSAPGTFGLASGAVDSGGEFFTIPHFGANWDVARRSKIGLSVYGNGGMNTDYPVSTYAGSSPTGVDLSQLFVAPSWARALGIDSRHAIGASAILAFQRFEMTGTEAFGSFSGAPTLVSNNGYDESFGVGLRVGYLGRLGERLSLGASYQTRIAMDPFDSYAGIFAEAGDFDIPATGTVGVAVDASSSLTLVADLQRIEYEAVSSIANPLLPNLVSTPLGTTEGAGFGWRDTTVYKVGVQWAASPDWTWRAGVASGESPIPGDQVFANIIAPAVVEEHLTVGFSRRSGSGRTISAALLHAPKATALGANPLELPGAQTIELEMSQWELELSIAWGRGAGTRPARFSGRKRDRPPSITTVDPLADREAGGR